MTASWRLATALGVLRDRVDELHPDRPRGADGTIGDPAHAARASDHNPNVLGVVTAWDCTAAPFVDDLAEQLRRLGRSGDRRVKYVIWKGRIASAVDRWAWRPYDGDPHTGHLHLSLSGDPAQYARTDPWPIGQPREDDDDMTPDELRDVLQDELAKVHGTETKGKDADPTHVSLLDVLRAQQATQRDVDALAKALGELAARL